MTLLTRDQILAAELKTERVDVPEWGEDAQVIVSQMMGTAREKYERLIYDKRGKPRSVECIRACLVACTAVNEDGELLFSMGDVEALGKKQSVVLHRIYAASLRLNGMDSNSTKDAAKNS